jgi:hypothetical protein
MRTSPTDPSQTLPPRPGESQADREAQSDSRWNRWTESAERHEAMRRRGWWVIAGVIAVGSLTWLVFTTF